VRAGLYGSREGIRRMEMLAAMRKEVNSDLERLSRDVGHVPSEIREVAARVGGTLDSLSTVLEHIGRSDRSQVSTSGVTPLMSP